ncbi:TAXI family TRAP transporter solute-binding subunit [Saccharopolyspora rhizosphaerae]|uniref:TAXI family TRAP transporter solute-binding subunit n=1 Tax=Saccharopolyspora rhizosphaerae TaxID=2492662 RepID=A0A3R8Q075_9PSEU|nr:TAXI family TRAP transporter solute-binding subunit [Saccharopolyspora rhizosphaerae]RRO15696.1 TAXI family TRAP transporter solute-binding subunit [Saccharopolyspora rhizosphaerae]
MRRRAFLGLGLLTACGKTEPVRELRIAAGEPGGFYTAFGALLGAEIAAAEPGVHPVVLPSQGSVDNLEMLRDGRADLGMVLADAAHAALAGELRPMAGLQAVGRVYENYTQLVVPADSPARSVDDLRSVAIGAPKSGTALMGARLFAGRPGLRTEMLPLAEAVTALEQGRIEAFLWSGGLPTPVLKVLDDRIGIRLLPVNAASARCTPVCDQLPVPPGAYRHTGGIPTIGVPNLLACSPQLPDELASAVVRVLVRRAPFLVPRETVGTQFLDVRTLIGTGDVPLHPGAAATYRDLHG